MLSLDLFDSKYERRLHEGAVDQLEQHRIDVLNDRMQELLARAKESSYKNDHAALSSLKRQYDKIKAERDSYYKIREAGIPGKKDYAYHRAKERQHELAGDKLMAKANSFGAYAHPTGIAARKKAEQHYAKADEHRAAWKELGSGPLKEGSMKRWLWSEAERLEKEDFIANADDYGMSEQEAAEFWDSINDPLDEAGIPGNVPTEKIPGKEELLKGRGRTYYEADQVNEYFVRSGDDIMSVMSLNLFKDLLGDASLSNYDEEFANSPEWQAVVAKWAPKAEHLQKELVKYQNTGRKLRDTEADAIHATVYDGGDAYEDAETAASYLPKVYAKQASALVRLLKDGYANPPAGMHEDDGRIVSQNPAPTPLTPKQELEDRALQVRRKKQNLLKRFANGGVIVEIEWALEHNVFMTKEQMLDYLDHTVEDPDLEPIEYMHDKGFTSDSMIKGLFKRLVGLGLSKSQILGIIKNGDQGKPASPSLISRIAGRVLRSEVSENQAFVPAVGDEIMWRPKNAKMAPTPVTVVATTPDKLKIKLQSPRMIQNAGKDTIVVGISNSDIFPKLVDDSLNEDDVEDFLKAGGKITYGKPQKGPRSPGLGLASRHIGGGRDKMKPSRTGRGAHTQGKPVVSTEDTQKKNSRSPLNQQTQVGIREHGGGIGPRQHWQDLMPEEELIEGIKDTTAATAVIACLLTGGSLTGCATAPQQTTAQQVLRTGQDIGRTVQSAKKITRASAEAEVQQEIRNVLRGINRPEELNNSNILRIWKRIKGQPPVSPEPQAPEYGPANPVKRPATEAREIKNQEDYHRALDSIDRQLRIETTPAVKQILRKERELLVARAQAEGWGKKPVISESNAGEAAEQAILKRIMVAHTDLLKQYGPEKVMQAAEEVAYNVGDVDEIGTSDVSGWVRQVQQILGATA